MKKTLCLCMIALSLCACTKNGESNADQDPKGCDDNSTCAVGNQADMSDYEGFIEEHHQFIEVPMSDFLLKLDANASGIYYFGFAACPWCIEALPIMNEVAKEKAVTIYYIDKKAETSDDASVAAIENRLSDILDKDEDGNPHLYVPFVIVIEEGEIISYHLGTVETHDAHERKMNEDEKKQLKAIYQEMFSTYQP